MDGLETRNMEAVGVCSISGHTRCRDAARFLVPSTEMPVQQLEADALCFIRTPLQHF